MTDHFKPLWSKNNAPRFGIAHAMALGLGPWLEIPEMIEKGVVTYTGKKCDLFWPNKIILWNRYFIVNRAATKKETELFFKGFFLLPYFCVFFFFIGYALILIQKFLLQNQFLIYHD